MTARLKIVHIITRLVVGGAQENTILSCARMDPDRFESVLVVGPDTGPEGHLFDEARELGVRVIVDHRVRRSIRPADDVASIVSLARRLRQERPDVVHTHSSKAGILGRIAARLAIPDAAVIHTVHGWSFHDHMARTARAGYIAAERLVARWTERLVVVTALDEAKGLAAGIGAPSRYTLIRSGFDLEPFRVTPTTVADVRRELALPADAVVVGSIMRLSTQKDPTTWLAAAQAIAAHRPNSYFVIVGDGPLRGEIERTLAANGLTDRVRLLGVRRDVGRLLSAFDVFLLTSLWEGLPKVVLQAMAAGVPVVATATDGVAEVVRDGMTGILVPPRDAGAAADAVLRVLDDPVSARRLVEGARNIVPEFDARRMVERLAELYTSVTSARSPRATAR